MATVVLEPTTCDQAEQARLTPYRFSVAQFYKLAELGILGEDDRVELIEGVIAEMSPIGSQHADRVDVLAGLLINMLGDRARVRVQNPIHLDDDNEPQPDLAIVTRKRYAEAHPAPGDILLLIEVAETTVRSDRDIKVPLYGRAGVPEVWVVDLINQVVWRYRQPFADGYERHERLKQGDVIASTLSSDLTLTIGVDDLFAL